MTYKASDAIKLINNDAGKIDESVEAYFRERTLIWNQN